ncbi:spore coat protein CotJB [Paenibacillus puerhi]|uniref:spore coat protein CotJB n=1 Tax=Paenibacillus puerhi TaxID=2692622 RepID=UPI00135CEE7C|nr:spore coat protein CotJB [Paenibacillus puerhi]
MSHTVPEHYYTKLKELQAIDFVIVELTLYLDTHPDDIQALEQYNRFVQHRMQIAQEFQNEFGPLTSFGYSFSKAPWQWKEAPWPWQV